MTTTASFLEMLAEREQAARAQGEYLRTQIEQLTGQLHELEGHLADLATTRNVILNLADGEPRPPEPPDLPGNPAYQNILAARIARPRTRQRPLPPARPRPGAEAHRGDALEAQTPGDQGNGPGLFALNRK